MNIVLLTLLTFTSLAHARFGTGLNSGRECLSEYGPGRNSIDGRDEIRNLQGRAYKAKAEYVRKKKSLEGYDDRISSARDRMRKVLSGSQITAIEQHRRFGLDMSEYQSQCAEGGSSAPSEKPDVILPGEGGATTPRNPDRHPVPGSFCVGSSRNLWKVLAADGGSMDESVCDYVIGADKVSYADDRKASACKTGLNDYYSLMAKKDKLEEEVAELERNLGEYGRDAERIQEEIAEGTYCPGCESERRGLSTSGTSNWLDAGLGILSKLATGYLNNRRQQQSPRYMPYPGQQAYRGRPIVMPMRGHHSLQNRQWGGMAVGVGRGSFACQQSPSSSSDPFAYQSPLYMNMENDPFSNPFADPFGDYGNEFADPSSPFAFNPLLNPGFGPGFMPELGNGLDNYNEFDPFNDDMYDQFGNRRSPLFMPLRGQQQRPYWDPNTGRMVDPGYWDRGGWDQGYDQWGRPQWAGGRNGSPLALRYPADWSNGGAWNSALVNYQHLAGSNPWGARYVPSPVNHFYYQIEQMKRNVSGIKNGAYNNGASPLYLPMPQSTIYNQPGTNLNPVPR